jgi:hypothetical protein
MVVAGIAVFALVGLVLAQGAPQAKDAKPAAKVNHYIGADKCKNCHQAGDKGNQWAAWQKSKHALAYTTLSTDAAKKLAKEKGIEDPLKADACLKCHVTAFGRPEEEVKKGFDIKLGVQCETCHGPGEAHMKARMAEAAKSEGDSKDPIAIPAGEIISHVDQKTCLACHNSESPSFKPFCFYKRAAEIRHADPRKKAEHKECGCGETCSCKDGCDEGKCAAEAKK